LHQVQNRSGKPEGEEAASARGNDWSVMAGILAKGSQFCQ
jgi:hypothetical protein